jgi:hypothetical protein
VSALLCCLACQAATVPGAAAPRGEEEAAAVNQPLFRVTRERVAGGAELLTVFGRVDAGFSRGLASGADSVPLASILRDLGATRRSAALL